MIFKAYISPPRVTTPCCTPCFSILLIIDSIVLVAAILLQAGQGGGMAASFGGVSSSASSFLGTRQAGNLLTKASWWCGGSVPRPLVPARARVDAQPRSEVGSRPDVRAAPGERTGAHAGDRRSEFRRSADAGQSDTHRANESCAEQCAGRRREEGADRRTPPPKKP